MPRIEALPSVDPVTAPSVGTELSAPQTTSPLPVEVFTNGGGSNGHIDQRNGFSAQETVLESFRLMESELPEGIVDGQLLHADHQQGLVLWKDPEGLTNMYRLPREQAQHTLTPIVTTVFNAHQEQPK